MVPFSGSQARKTLKRAHVRRLDGENLFREKGDGESEAATTGADVEPAIAWLDEGTNEVKGDVVLAVRIGAEGRSDGSVEVGWRLDFSKTFDLLGIRADAVRPGSGRIGP